MIKLKPKERDALKRYWFKEIKQPSEVCHLVGWKRRDGYADLNYFHRAFHSYMMGSDPLID